MDLATLCTFVVSLRVEPKRAQFFQYEEVSLSCSPGWSLLRNTTLHQRQKNPLNESSWSFMNIYYKDSGVYWCQSEEGQCGAAVNITVTGGEVVLESPVQPVTEGETVTLKCIYDSDHPVLNGTFEFFRGGSWIRKSSSAELSLVSVSVEDSGLYMCSYAEQLSAESPLLVTTAARPPQEEDDSLFTLLVVVFPVTLSLLLVLALLCLCRDKHREGEKPEVDYSNVTIVQTPEPRRLRDLRAEDESTFYSRLQLDFMK